MKTNVRTIIGIVALGIIAFTNINATSDNKREVNLEVVEEKEPSLTIEPWMLENSDKTIKTNADTVEVEKALEIEAWMIDESL